ncbi:MAG: uracil-DNA glycosylase [Phycisphaeraceae bacterium]
MANLPPLRELNERIVRCRRCKRLRDHCQAVARKKTARFREQAYWGKPVPNLVAPGRRAPRLLVVGLAPAAHGANRTGRMFTGDRSGDFLFRAMHETGFCNQPEAWAADDGLALRDAAITATVHCAPPDNKPTPDEQANCREYLVATFEALPRLRAVVCLGQLAHTAVLRLYKQRGWIDRLSDHPFAHGALHRFTTTAPPIVDSYHPSQQNTFTGRLTPAMLRQVFEQARQLVEA